MILSHSLLQPRSIRHQILLAGLGRHWRRSSRVNSFIQGFYQLKRLISGCDCKFLQWWNVKEKR
ncbi:hypothetical protein L210DRAFT_3573758 [Boletus edulis BED1]|uniref:Uncharacterized protein n=1 Tax=Boletus edulis BED1 TaxID=1328754 RepID=A0AAD4BDU6_BOLED|nr:hypothetical protein L210DRAFT_3573758 [Boletus edulis BED1]